VESYGYLKVIRRHIWLIILTVLLTTFFAYTASRKQKPLYRATAIMSISTLDSSSLPSKRVIIRKDDMDQIIENEIIKTSNPSIARDVIKKLQLNLESEQLLSMMSLDMSPGTGGFAIECVNSDPKRAARIANEFAESVVKQSIKEETAPIESQLENLQQEYKARKEEIANLGNIISSSQIPSDPNKPLPVGNLGLSPETYAEWSRITNSYEWLGREIDELSLIKKVTVSPLRLVQRADVPKTPFAPDTKKNVLVGVAAGLILGIGAVFSLEFLDSSLKTNQELEQYFALPVLGTVRASSKKIFEKDAYRIISQTKPNSSWAESYRTLRTNLQFLSDQKGPGNIKTLLVTNACSVQGVPEVLANLAVTFAKTGSKIALICCNLRNPKLHHFFGADNARGLVDVLKNEATLGSINAVMGIPGITVITSGVLKENLDNPADLLSSPKLDKIISDLRNQADLVLIDAPSIIETADTCILVQKADAVVIVASSGEVTRELATKARRILDQVEAPLLGIVKFVKNPKST